ncbi:transposase family protein [Microcoleus sp. AT9_B4]
MLYEQAKTLKSSQFKRRFGVSPKTFNQMVEVVRDNIPSKKKAGRPIKLSLENQVLVTLEYWREYRTYFHIGTSWKISLVYGVSNCS